MDSGRNRISRLFSFLVTVVLIAVSSSAEAGDASLAGKWYTSSKKALEEELCSYLEKAAPPPIEGKIIALISPHAGFVYSGPVAAYGFKAVQSQKIKKVFVIGFSHRMYYDGVAVLDDDAFRTPLGVVKIDRDLTKELTEQNPKIQKNPSLFYEENSVEMEIPFLQTALKDFEIVLIAIGNQSFQNSRILADALYEVLKDKEDFLLVASTDMCHYLPYEKANETDKKTISMIKEFDPDKLYRESLAGDHKFMCGYGAVCATMIAAKMLGADKIEILKYANSGDTRGDKSRVVGYLSAAIVKSTVHSPQSTDKNLKKEIGNNDMLNSEQRKKMLKLARDSINYYLKEGKKLPVKESDQVLNKEMGAFVTLHKRGQLRGCIGNIIGQQPFYLTVRDMALEAATGDPRFRPVTIEEMSDIDIEISALSPLEKIDDPEKIEMKKHGVIVRQGFRSGVYLPQVAAETGWNREQFMNSLCGHKAGIDSDAWKKGKCDIYIFTAEVFGEKDK